MGLAELFENLLLPLAIEGGKCLLYVSLVSGVYVLIRGSVSDSVKKIKTATIGYFFLRMIKSYVDLIDKLASNMQF